MPYYAAKALMEIGDSRGVEAILAVLRYKVSSGAPENYRNRRDQTFRALQDIGGPAALRLVRGMLGHEDKQVRRLAVRALGVIGGTDDFDVLLATLTDREKDIRREAVEALAAVGGTRALGALRAALEDKDKGVRICAMRALEQMDDPAS